MYARISHHRSMTGVVAIALAGTAGLAVTAPVSAIAASVTTVAVQNDPPRDAVASRARGITLAQKRSIDMRQATLRRVGNQGQFVIALRNVQRVRSFDQMFHIVWSETLGAPSDRWEGDIWFSAKSRYAEAIYTSPDYRSYQACNAPVAIRPLREEVVVTVPWRCVPEGPLKVWVQSSTGHYRTDAPTWSHDNLRFSGTPTVLTSPVS